MSISNALKTSVSGLKANSVAISGISENIANANTVGYRRSFSHMISTAATNGTQEGGVLSVVASKQTDMSRLGGLISTESETDLAISGEGFLVVSETPNATSVDNYLLTRAGSFLPDENGNFVNAAGYYLAGFQYDENGDPLPVDRSSYSSLSTVSIGSARMTADATTEISLRGNLPSQSTGLATPGSAFTSSSQYNTALGAIERVRFSLQPTSQVNTWNVTLSDNDGVALGSFTLEFNDSGALSGSPKEYSNVTNFGTGGASFALDVTTGNATVVLDNGTTPQQINISFGGVDSFDGVTQFAGDYNLDFSRDGSSTGELIRAEFDDSGVMYGVFDNGLRRALFEVPLSVVDDANGLQERRGNAYQMTMSSGSFQLLSPSGGNVGILNSGALEASNVDIAQEMTEMIKVQRSFSTNASVVTAADEMLEETTRLKR